MINKKFRVWDSTNELWIDRFVIHSDGGIETYSTHETRSLVLNEAVGTKDKHKNLIFEDDIVHISRQIIHIDPAFKEDWEHPDFQEREKLRAYLLENNLVQIAEYEEVGIVKRSAVRWSLSPYVAKVVTFENSKIKEQWIEPGKARQLRVNRGLWIVEVIGNKHEHLNLYTDKLKLT